MISSLYRKCDDCGDLEAFNPYITNLQNESSLCTKCRNGCKHKSVLHKFRYMTANNGLDTAGNVGYAIRWQYSSISNKKRKNILVDSVAQNGVMTLMIDIYCDGCMRWVRIPFYSPNRLFHAQKVLR